ncbi:hypothetical protein IEQ34_012228 [Dendrobium chrysotoxum]|uniref:Uncharacterized protein n=1 Tax=Dendrobium chrysotoxum TaxID=161865 RepID=A0AAV7GUG9_DENCH|nr:hypothetical protein IEQ34_012228 [Dendrobium chrysotoxum]
MLDLDCVDLILEMFQHFLKTIREFGILGLDFVGNLGFWEFCGVLDFVGVWVGYSWNICTRLLSACMKVADPVAWRRTSSTTVARRQVLALLTAPLVMRPSVVFCSPEISAASRRLPRLGETTRKLGLSHHAKKSVYGRCPLSRTPRPCKIFNPPPRYEKRVWVFDSTCLKNAVISPRAGTYEYPHHAKKSVYRAHPPRRRCRTGFPSHHAKKSVYRRFAGPTRTPRIGF